MSYLFFLGPLLMAIVAALIIAAALRRVVPTNMVHIVQSSKKTTPYGRDKPAGNTYYQFPEWIPRFGVSVSKFPESNFQVNLADYEAYDQKRLPFVVSVTAFFRVKDAAVAAQRVSSFDILVEQLENVVQGAVRNVLANSALEDIMQARATLAEQFTNQVNEQLEQWGVTTVKSIEFMDIRDAAESVVIKNIMRREMARIDRESREQVAEHSQAAEKAEIEAKREIDLTQQQALEQVGQRTAETERNVGIAAEKSRQSIAEEQANTAEKDLAVQRIKEVNTANIQREVATVEAERNREVELIAADQDKQSVTIRAEGALVEAQREAEGIKARGEAQAAAEAAMQRAPVTAQIELAKEIGENPGYQTYLVSIEQIKAGQRVGEAMAEAMGKADLKVIANGGTLQGGVSALGDMFNTSGGTNLAGMLSALGQTSEGAAVLSKLGTGLVAGKAAAQVTGSPVVGALAGAVVSGKDTADATDTLSQDAPAAPHKQ